MDLLDGILECRPLILSLILGRVVDGFDWEVSGARPFLASTELGQDGAEGGLVVEGGGLDGSFPTSDEVEPPCRGCAGARRHGTGRRCPYKWMDHDGWGRRLGK